MRDIKESRQDCDKDEVEKYHSHPRVITPLLEERELYGHKLWFQTSQAASEYMALDKTRATRCQGHRSKRPRS